MKDSKKKSFKLNWKKDILTESEVEKIKKKNNKNNDNNMLHPNILATAKKKKNTSCLLNGEHLA